MWSLSFSSYEKVVNARRMKLIFSFKPKHVLDVMGIIHANVC